MTTKRLPPPKAAVVGLWSVTIVFLALSAFLLPASIWGTSALSPLSGGRIFFFTAPTVVVALVLLTLAIWTQRLRRVAG